MLTTPGKIRDIMGLHDDVSIDDSQIISLIKVAQEIIKKDLFIYHYDETPGDNPDTGASWDGSNTRFQLEYPIMDADFDGDVDGDDVTGYWISSSYTPSSCSISVVNSRYGLVDIYQSDGSTPIPSDAEDILVTYYSMDVVPSDQQLEELCTYLTAHLVELRLTEPKHISIADLESNKRFIELRSTRYYEIYKNLLNTLRKPLIRGT